MPALTFNPQDHVLMHRFELSPPCRTLDESCGAFGKAMSLSQVSGHVEGDQEAGGHPKMASPPNDKPTDCDQLQYCNLAA